MPFGGRGLVVTHALSDADQGVLALDPDRLFPQEQTARMIARELYAEVAEAPIISPHGHVDPHLFLENARFSDPVELLLRRDHYVTRLLHASGVPLSLIYDESADPRVVWRAFSEHWDAFQGTASSYWLRHELGEQFGVSVEPSADNADWVYEQLSARIQTEEFRPRALFNRFGLEVLATTDDPLDDLSVHEQIAASGALNGRVIPTFRPDTYTDPTAPRFVERLERLVAVTGTGAVDDYRAYLEALRARRSHFRARGAVSSDHGVRSMATLDLPFEEASSLYRQAIRGELDAAGAAAFTAQMLTEMAGMSVDDGLVMTVHPGIFRNHDSSVYAEHGPDTGHDIPIATEYTHNLRPLLERHGGARGFHLVLFTVDETSFSREIAPLAGYYPSVFIGAPWWFLDAPDAVQRFRAAVTETAGLTRGSGFIDDTRALMSIPARHDMSRRADAAFLARLVAEGRMPADAARRLIVRMTVTQPKQVFKL